MNMIIGPKKKLNTNHLNPLRPRLLAATATITAKNKLKAKIIMLFTPINIVKIWFNPF